MLLCTLCGLSHTTVQMCVLSHTIVQLCVLSHIIVHATFQVAKSGRTLKEYQGVEQLFHRTLPSKVIKCIKRVQNYDLWERYDRY